MPDLIYVVDDEENILEIIEYNLSRSGYNVKGFKNGISFLRYFSKKKPDLVVLDLMLPDSDGYDICKQIREESDIPVIILSAKSEEFDKVLGLELGADDYIVKPFGVRELIARVKSVLKRSRLNIKRESENNIIGDYKFNGINLIVNEDRHELILDSNKIKLNPKEFKVFVLLLKNLNNLVSRIVLIKDVWGEDYFGDTRTLDVHVRRIRKKMDYQSFGKKYIKTIHGFGYRLVSSI